MILLSVQTDPAIIFISLLSIILIMISFGLKKIKQPYIIGYILAGTLLGDQGIGMITDVETTEHIGEWGIILLLFFIGMEISLPDLVKQWRVAVIGTILQVAASVLVMLGIGWLLDWAISRAVILGFVIALSSSAIVIRLLEERHLMNSKLGKDILSILLMQDIILVPLIIATTFLGGAAIAISDIVLMLIGGGLMVGILVYLYVKRTIRLPFASQLEADHELQVFAAILFCFGGALLASLFGLSAALGAFLGGIVMHAAQSTHWIHNTLHSFRVLFVAVFFISIGLQIDFQFITTHFTSLFIALVAVYLTNHLLNTLVLKLYNESWRDAILGGAYLAQVGELSFLIAATAFQLNILEDFGYQFTISLISLTLLLGVFWVGLTELLLRRG